MTEEIIALSTTELLKLIGIASVISGIVSAIIGYFMKMKEFTKKNRAEFIQTRLNLYSFMIFHLDKMLLEEDNISDMGLWSEEFAIFDSEVGKETIKIIDDEIQDKLHLLNYDILSEWIKFKTYATIIIGDKKLPPVEYDITKTRELLVKEYNEILIPEYEKIVGKGVQKIPSRRRTDLSQDKT